MITKEEVLRREYAGRISRAVEMVYRCFGDDIGPDEMADAACFSRYHFHRVFHGMTGEGPAEFIRRIRLERAACFLMDNPSRPATDIALACGFSSPSVFARAFKERFGSSATEYRQARLASRPGEGGGGSKEGKEDGRPGIAEGSPGKAEAEAAEYLEGILNAQRRENMEAGKYKVLGIEVKELTPMTVAYLSHVGPYNQIEGLCVGWSESSRRSYDGTSYLQRFTPRKTIGTQSKRNLERARILVRAGRMTSAGLKALGWDSTWDSG